MNNVVSMACIQMRMLPEEAINAATINGAYAMELENEVEVFPSVKKRILFSQNKFLRLHIFLILSQII